MTMAASQRVDGFILPIPAAFARYHVNEARKSCVNVQVLLCSCSRAPGCKW